MTRRAFEHLALLLTPLAWTGGVLAGVLKFMSPLEPGRRKAKLVVGPVERLAGGRVESVVFNGRLIHVLEEKGEVVAVDAMCTHLECTVSWKAGEGCFVCPCHGGRFDRQGKVVAKPPVEPLRRQKLAIDGGQVVLLDEGV
ncbi:MAG: ubiquinol-cytochrome c reductase iron-sulfur subunit [Planctomycetes bacterium]|nr:ubiquinol-cytochrome c reductase iron-sulfur subunit [Planctomycetota bacterium]